MDPPPFSLIASITGSAEERICERESCHRPYASCTEEEKWAWKYIKNSRNSAADSIRWMCGPCVEHYRNKDSTQTRDDSVQLGVNQDKIKKNVAAAQRGKGRRTKVNVIGLGLAASSSTSMAPPQNILSRGCTYESGSQPPPVVGGYTGNHAKFAGVYDHWMRKAASGLAPATGSGHPAHKASSGSASRSVQDTVAIKVSMGVVMLGQTNIKQLHDCIEGLDEVDAHIGGDELHRKCYEQLQAKWLKYSKGYVIPLSETTLRGMKIHAAIAGKALTQPAKQSDAIWHFVYKTRGNAKEPTFKFEQVTLAVIMEYEDFQGAEENRRQYESTLANKADTNRGTRNRSLTENQESVLDVDKDVEPVISVEDSDADDLEDVEGTNGMLVGSKRTSQPTTPDNSLRRVKHANFISPDRESIYAALRAQQRKPDVEEMVPYFLNKTFPCKFFELPIASYDADCLPDDIFDLKDDGVDVHSGLLSVEFLRASMEQGKHKTAHPGRVRLDAGKELSPFTNQAVCVKQIYQDHHNNGRIGRVPGRHELSTFYTECNCIRWASILLDLTYQFIAHEIERRGEPTFHIPELRYTRSMVAIVQGSSEEKAYLVDKWITNDEGENQFVKYINNRHPISCVSSFAPPKAHAIAEFLLFSQHVQWQKTKQGAFVSDYQGAGRLLTDPQITLNPVHGNIFGLGNIPQAFTEFRVNHICNDYCRFFGLSLDVPSHTD